MHVLTLLLLVLASCCEAIAETWPRLSLVKLVPEAFSIVILLLVILEGLRKGFHNVAPKYWATFGLIAFIITCSILTNAVPPGPIFAGLRFYLRAIPLFLIPAVFPPTEKQLRQQLMTVLVIGLIQIPITIYQRYIVLSEFRHSGDSVRGTATDSGILSIILISLVLILLGYFMRKRLSKVAFFTLFFLLLLPTTINETKVTVVLLPLGLLTTIVAGSPAGKRLKVFSLGLALLVAFGAILIPVYSFTQQFNPHKDERSLVEFFTNENGEMDKYMESKHPTGLGTRQGVVRRGDAIRVPLEYLSKDPVRLAFGLGLGNATHSNLGESFTGIYYDLFQKFAYLSVSLFLLEIGVLGTALVFVLYAFVFFDSIAVAKADPSFIGTVAVGFIGVVVVVGISTFYTAIHTFSMLSFLYWYFAGVVASRRRQLELASAASKSRALRQAAA